MDYELRKPTYEERKKIAYAIIEATRDDEENIFEAVNNAYIAVFPSFVTGSPGYCGKVFLVAYDGGPDYYECFIEQEDGKMKKVFTDLNDQN